MFICVEGSGTEVLHHREKGRAFWVVRPRRLLVLFVLTTEDFRHIELRWQLRVPSGYFVVFPRAVPHPLPGYEDRALDHEGELHVLKRGSVLIPNKISEKLCVRPLPFFPE